MWQLRKTVHVAQLRGSVSHGSRALLPNTVATCLEHVKCGKSEYAMSM